MSDIFKVNNKDTRMTSSVFIVNFEHIFFIFTVNIVEFEQMNGGWA